MVVGKCDKCGRETTRNMLISWSPETFKPTLPLSVWACDRHTWEEAIRQRFLENSKVAPYDSLYPGLS